MTLRALDLAQAGTDLPDNQQEGRARAVGLSRGAPYIVGIGGSVRPFSSTEMAVRCALAMAQRLGAETVQFSGPELDFPTYTGVSDGLSPPAARLIEELRRADGVIIASPGYHGAISGMMKNALDYLEEMRGHAAPYLHGRAVGCIATAAGWQAASATLSNLRGIVHALRGWPTPLGVAINTAAPIFEPDGACRDQQTNEQLSILAAQVVEFARARARA